MTEKKKKYFYGNEISDYGVENGRVDYACLSKCFDAVLNNDILGMLTDDGYDFEQISGFFEDDDGEQYTPEVYQWFIVEGVYGNGIEILEQANEIVYYCEKLNMYLWGVTHYGTSWSYVLTDIEITW